MIEEGFHVSENGFIVSPRSLRANQGKKLTNETFQRTPGKKGGSNSCPTIKEIFGKLKNHLAAPGVSHISLIAQQQLSQASGERNTASSTLIHAAHQVGPGDGGVHQNFNNGSGDFHMAHISVPDDHIMLSGHVDNLVGPETDGKDAKSVSEWFKF